MTAIEERIDPIIEDHVAALAAALHGPARVKARMVDEVRDGLVDAVSALTSVGVPRHRAADQAVREFGTVDELVPSFQRELTIVQARHTARALALTWPPLIACWAMIWSADNDQDSQLLRTVQLVIGHLAGLAAITALLAAAALAATGALARWLPTPHRLPALVAWSSTTAAAAMAVAAVALAVTSPLAADWPLIALAGVLTAASHAVVATSARVCRRCARLPRPA